MGAERRQRWRALGLQATRGLTSKDSRLGKWCLSRLLMDASSDSRRFDRWASYPSFMDHLGQLSMFVLPELRGRQVGQRLKDWRRRHSSSRALTTTRSW